MIDDRKHEAFTASFVEPGKIHPLSDVILNPVAVPPFLWLDLNAVELHGEMDMITAGHSCLAAPSHHLASFHHVALVHIDMAQMAVDGLQAIAMVDHDAVAVDAQRSGIHNPAIVRRLDTNMLRDCQIVAEMDLLVDLLPLVDIVAQVGKSSFGLRMGLSREWLRP